MEKLKFQFNDGGRKDAGYLGTTGDCATRAIAIVTGKPYQEIYDMVNGLVASGKSYKNRKRGTSNARTGVWQKDVKSIMLGLGWEWTPTMLIGQGCKTHLRADELPKGKILCNVSRHYTAVIDGVINDIYDPSRGGSRCVYGYYSYKGKPEEPKPQTIEVAEAKVIEKPKTNKNVDKLNKLLTAQKKWTSKAKRAETALAKLNKKIKYYQKRMSK